MKVLFVCTANICRSPMAAEYMRHRAAHSNLSHLVVDSAGLLGITGAPASPESIQVLRELGLDLSDHRSKGVSEVELRTSDMVVVMTRQHVDELQRRFPQRSGRPLLIRAFENRPDPQLDPPDLEDPIGERIEIYRERFETMRGCLDHLALYLKQEP